MGLHKSEGNMDVAKKENAVILLEKDYSTKYEGFDPNSAESYIIFSLMQNTFLRQSLELASNVQTQFRDHVKRADRGVKQAGFLVLWKTSMPSVLIELGFISNSDEEKFLVSETGQDYLASAVYRAFKNYKAGIEQQSHFSPIDPAKIQPNSINKDTTTYFMVQLSSSKTPTPLNDLQFKGLNGVDQVNIKGTFKYVYGKTLIYDSAVKSKQEIKELFPDSFIISIRNNEQISLLEALKSIKNKP